MRWCKACGRPIEEHMIVGRRYAIDPRGKIPGHLDKVYQCDVRPITNETAFDFLSGEWVPGERSVPESMQRTARNPARYVHVDALQAIARREQT